MAAASASARGDRLKTPGSSEITAASTRRAMVAVSASNNSSAQRSRWVSDHLTHVGNVVVLVEVVVIVEVVVVFSRFMSVDFT